MSDTAGQLSPDVVVIGAGVAGVTTALRLQTAGAQVTIIDRGRIGAEASSANAGLLGTASVAAASDLDATLQVGSRSLIQALQTDQGYQIGYRRSGEFMALHDTAGSDLAWADAELAAQTAAGHRVELLDRAELAAIEPWVAEDLVGALYWPDGAQADPLATVRAFASQARHLGVRFQLGEEVLGIRHDRTSFQIELSDRFETAPTLVLAAGVWTRPLGALVGLDVPVVAVRGQMWSTPPMPPRVFATVTSAESARTWAASAAPSDGEPPRLTHRGDVRVTRHLYGRQRRNGEVIFGGDRRLVGLGAPARAVDPEGIAVNRAHAAGVFPFLRVVPTARTWSGLMPFTIDGRPLLGPVEQIPGLHLVTGLGSSGFMRGPMAGSLVADAILSGTAPGVLAPALAGDRVTMRAKRQAQRV